MNSITRFATIAATAISIVAAPLASATAMPRMGPAKVESAVSVEKTHGRKWRRDGNWGQHRYYSHRRHRHHGHRHHYRGYGGADIAAGIAGVIIGSAIANANRPVYRGGGNAHVNWCYNHYKSYRAYDDTFQPYSGPRKRCDSPYN